MTKYAKALVGAAVAGLTSLHSALDDGGVTAQEAIAAAIAALLALGLVGAVPNRRP